MRTSSIGVQVMVASSARAELDSVCNHAVTVHATGTPAAPSLHFTTLDALEDWYHDLGTKIVNERLRRTGAPEAIAQMRETLRKVGVR